MLRKCLRPWLASELLVYTNTHVSSMSAMTAELMARVAVKCSEAEEVLGGGLDAGGTVEVLFATAVHKTAYR